MPRAWEIPANADIVAQPVITDEDREIAMDFITSFDNQRELARAEAQLLATAAGKMFDEKTWLQARGQIELGALEEFRKSVWAGAVERNKRNKHPARSAGHRASGRTT